ncbi:MAG: hypothetical protein M3Z26_08365 [Bacteroidota bacterium]|nr:hypothetical protein [Bacteroidota bacterium]
MGKKKKIFIIHFHPLELYPPVMNMIDYLGKEKGIELIVVSNRKLSNNLLAAYIPPAGVKIYRPTSQKSLILLRYVNYMLFYIGSLFSLIIHRPEIVLYFETLSSWPALMYKKMKGKRIRLMVHYHEYTEPKLYEEGMFLSKWMYGFENKMYHHFSWISHTNPVRMQMFKKDNSLEKMPENIFHIIPNYPSKSWLHSVKKNGLKPGKKRLVFVGSLGYENMYLQEVIDWLGKHTDDFSLDVYSYNIDDKAKEVLEINNFKNIRYCGGRDYQSLPTVLSNYDIGIVIYKPFSQNTIHAVSNKVFEYLACGLDVWFSIDMTYTFNYVRKDVFPKLLPVNFMEFDSFDPGRAIAREGLSYDPGIYFYENIYPEILAHISNDNSEMVI